MHPLLVTALLVSFLPVGVAGTGGAVDAGGHAPAVPDPTVEQVELVNETNETAVAQPTRSRSPGYMVGSFFIRFGPTILVIGLLLWIFLGGE